MDLELFKDKILAAAFDDADKQRDIEALIKEYFIGKPIPMIPISPQYLGRCRYNRDSKIFKNVSELSYNPKIEEIYLQRCNYAGQQIFYGALPTKSKNASLLSTAVVEVCMEYIKQDDLNEHMLTLSRWQIQRPLNIFILPYSKESHLQNEDFKELKDQYDAVLANINKDGGTKGENFIKALEFISDIFCTTEDKEKYYKISAAFFNFYMNAATMQNVQIDGLVYPSANTEAAGINIALKKEIIDNEDLYCDKTIMYKGRRLYDKPRHFYFEGASNEIDVNGNKDFQFILTN